MRSLVPVAVALTFLALAYPLTIAAQPAPAPTSQPAPADASPSPPPAPPTAGPIPSPSPTASGTPSPYHYVVNPPAPAPGQPAIFEIDMLDQTIRPGAPYSVRVKTSLDVTTLNVSTMGQTVGMQGAGPGLFATDGQVPGGVPFFLMNRTYTVILIAGTADGRSTSVPVTLRLEH